ncbi:ATP phosphoribosyltransferase regulatory subunit, partial [Pseudomonas syringae]
ELEEVTKTLPYGQDFYNLGRYSGNLSLLEQHLSNDLLKDTHFQAAFDGLKTTVKEIQKRWPNLSIGLDVVELRSYHYHTGLMYA